MPGFAAEERAVSMGRQSARPSVADCPERYFDASGRKLSGCARLAVQMRNAPAMVSNLHAAHSFARCPIETHW
jgi:hypothetical protein